MWTPLMNKKEIEEVYSENYHNNIETIPIVSYKLLNGVLQKHLLMCAYKEYVNKENYTWTWIKELGVMGLVQKIPGTTNTIKHVRTAPTVGLLASKGMMKKVNKILKKKKKQT